MERGGISDLDARRREAARYGPPFEQSAAMRGLAPFQMLLIAVVLPGSTAAVQTWPDRVAGWLIAVAACAFLGMAIWRVVLIVLSAGSRSTAPDPAGVAALYHRGGAL